MADIPDQQPIDFVQAAAERRWGKSNGNPIQHPPEDALHQALKRMRESPTPAKAKRHAIVIWVDEFEEDGGIELNFTNAGSASLIGQLGMVERVKALLYRDH